MHTWNPFSAIWYLDRIDLLACLRDGKVPAHVLRVTKMMAKLSSHYIKQAQIIIIELYVRRITERSSALKCKDATPQHTHITPHAYKGERERGRERERNQIIVS